MTGKKSMLQSFIEKDSSVDCTCDIINKQKSIFNYMMYMFDRTNQMFEYTGLPDTIPAYYLELYLQMNGQVCITKVDGALYALPGAPGGAPDPYFRPTLYVVANPGLGFSKSLRIMNHLLPYNKDQSAGGECVMIKNDTMMNGLYYMFSRYATEMAENDVSIRCAQINARHQAFINATTDRDVDSAQEYLDNLVAGKLTAVASKNFLDGIKTDNLSVQSANTIIQLIELQQYLKASWYNEIGLNSNFNMKREYLSAEEIRSSTDVLLPLIDDMLRCRKDAIEMVNKIYGTNISVDKNSAWENKQAEVDTAQEVEESKIDIPDKEESSVD